MPVAGALLVVLLLLLLMLVLLLVLNALNARAMQGIELKMLMILAGSDRRNEGAIVYFIRCTPCQRCKIVLEFLPLLYTAHPNPPLLKDG
jgi:hypothetical protein